MLVSELRKRLADYSFYHVIQLTDDLSTPGWEAFVPLQQNVLQALRSLDLAGKSVLDLGCRDGLFCFEAERLGAQRVVGIDNDLSRGAVELLIPFFSSQVHMYEMNVYDMTPEVLGSFDVVICAGLLYHLRYPFWGLHRIRDVMRADATLILETAYLVDDDARPMLFCPRPEDSPYDPTSCTFFNLKGLEDTLASFGIQIRERLIGRETIANQVSVMKVRETTIDRVCLICDLTTPTNDFHSQDVDRYWHAAHDFHSQAVLPLGYNVAWLSTPQLSSVAMATVIKVPITVRNEGDAPWKHGDPNAAGAGETFLCYRWLAADASTIVDLHGRFTPLPYDVPPKVAVDVIMDVEVTLTTPGPYVLELFLAYAAQPRRPRQVGAPLRLPVSLA